MINKRANKIMITRTSFSLAMRILRRLMKINLNGNFFQVFGKKKVEVFSVPIGWQVFQFQFVTVNGE